MLRRALALPIVALALAASAVLARDHGADGKWSKRRSSHFELYQDVALARYSGPTGSRAFEVAVLDVLESAHDRVRDRIGVEPRNGRVLVFVYDPGIFDASFGGRFGFRPAGFWDGAIQVRGGTQVDARLVSTLWHEYTHAALASLAPPGTFPAWLNEGLAELFEREAVGRSGGPTADEIVALRTAAGSGQWLALGELSGPTFAGLDETTARLAYLESYAVVEQMTYRYGPERVERFVEEIAKTRSVDLALKRALRIDLAELEGQLWSRQP